jgi:nucleoside-diphosphate-sugar epimerase
MYDFSMNKVIWLTGSRGFVGTEVANHLRGNGYSLKCLTNSAPKKDGLIHVDFADPTDICKTIQEHGVPETFLHVGWGSVFEPHSTERQESNLQNGINLINELFEAGLKRFILIGSSSEYGTHEGPLREDLKFKGIADPYVRAKLDLANYGFLTAEELHRTFISIRLFYTYGGGQTHNSLINQLYRSHISRTPISLSPCDQFRDYIHVSEVAEGIERICQIEKSTIVNLGSGRAILVKEFVYQIWNQLGGNPEHLLFGSHERPELERIQPLAYADLSTLETLSGWSPKLSVEEGIRKTVLKLKEINKIS